ncbi:MAG TPA: hypothetical protein VHZ74_01905 [Bryobacteraceae bacterium]|jgi:hypothetical protein|nr:hypothetical protein [Bryobacteraceae bacterium]
MRLYRGLAGLLLLAVSAFAADVDGKWAGSMSTPMGDIPVGFTLKSDGAALTGSTTGPDGAAIAIKDGKVDGANITFSVTFDFGGMPFTLIYKGVVSSDSIKFTGDAGGMPFELTVKKDK